MHFYTFPKMTIVKGTQGNVTFFFGMEKNVTYCLEKNVVFQRPCLSCTTQSQEMNIKRK